jgi:dolichol-phosphate mannosyltransferase
MGDSRFLSTGRHDEVGRRVSVVLPTLDEAENIDRVLSEIIAAGEKASLDLEVIVVDDGSADGTRERVRAWESRDPRVRLLAREGERGLAQAVLAGSAAATGEVVVVMDADLSHPPEVVPVLAEAVLGKACAMAIGSRYLPGGSTPGWPLKRRLFSRGAAALAGLLVDARDPCSGFFATRRATLLAAGREARGFKIGLEVLAGLTPDARILEVPITFRDRAHGASKLGAGVECARAPWRPLWRRPSSGTSSRGTSSAGRGRRSR